MVTKTLATKENKHEAVKRAIDNAHDHSGIDLPVVLNPTGPNDQKKNSGSGASDNEILIKNWEDIQKQWEGAQRNIGTISEGGRYYIELWRAKTDLPGYIAWCGKKREAIQRIWRELSNFKIESGKNLGILLEADPGVGKTYLAKQLAYQCKFPLITHDISQMVQREELLDLFDMIAAKQAEQDSPVFVFVDEINASLGGSPVYGGFLAPLEAGKYMRRGRLCELKPCVWMFAGTLENSGRDERNNKREKVEDFKSRLTIIEQVGYRSLQRRCGTFGVNLEEESWNALSKGVQSLRLKGAEDEEIKGITSEKLRNIYVGQMVAGSEIDELISLDHQTRLEQVYMGAQWINDAFNDVCSIHWDLLIFFYRLDPSSAPARTIKRLASSLENIQYGKAHKGNCTSDLWNRTVSKLLRGREQYNDWMSKTDKDVFVDIKFD
jgi:hypothetical protein